MQRWREDVVLAANQTSPVLASVALGPADSSLNLGPLLFILGPYADHNPQAQHQATGKSSDILNGTDFRKAAKVIDLRLVSSS